MSDPLNKNNDTPELKAARERLARIAEVEQIERDSATRTAAAKAEAEAALAAAEAEHGEAAAMAARSGEPIDVALRKLREARGQVPANALEMTPAQYAEHRRKMGLV